VCDVNGAKIGTVARVYRENDALVVPGRPARDEIVELKTGFLGLGKRLYVPLREVSDISGGAAFLGRAKEDLDPGWEIKPAHLQHLN
jgi:hypothetical protein